MFLPMKISTSPHKETPDFEPIQLTAIHARQNDLPIDNACGFAQHFSSLATL